MSNEVSVTFNGLDETMRALASLPQEFRDYAALIIATAANDTAQETSAHYPLGPTGNLRAGVVVRLRRDETHISAKVISGAPHASMLERGTKPRFTKKRFVASRGFAHPLPEDQRLVPRAMRIRRRMREQLIALVREAGFEVTES